jgi:hypothetical protein
MTHKDWLDGLLDRIAGLRWGPFGHAIELLQPS